MHTSQPKIQLPHIRGNVYKYGEAVSYRFELLRADDYDDLQLFQCGNEKLNNHIKSGVIQNDMIIDKDGLYFKFTDCKRETILGIASLATSGVLVKVGGYSHILPAIKIDIFAIDRGYQKLHYDAESENASQKDEHYYFSDDVLGNVVQHCKKIAEQYAYADYIVVYADKNAYRFYERNGFCDFNEYMMKEQNAEISENIPMYLDLNN